MSRDELLTVCTDNGGGNKNLDKFLRWNMDKGVKGYHFENSKFKKVG